MSEVENGQDGEPEEDEPEEPAVDLGDGQPVDGAPLARVASRLSWGIENSTVEAREGDVEIRTPDGPRELADVLAEVDVPYFERRQEFIGEVRSVIGDGPIPTAEE
jgi:hypothetical protein